MAFYRKRRVPPRIAEPVFSFIDCPRSRELWFGVRLHSSTTSSPGDFAVFIQMRQNWFALLKDVPPTLAGISSFVVCDGIDLGTEHYYPFVCPSIHFKTFFFSMPS